MSVGATRAVGESRSVITNSVLLFAPVPIAACMFGEPRPLGSMICCCTKFVATAVVIFCWLSLSCGSAVRSGIALMTSVVRATAPLPGELPPSGGLVDGLFTGTVLADGFRPRLSCVARGVAGMIGGEVVDVGCEGGVVVVLPRFVAGKGAED